MSRAVWLAGAALGFLLAANGALASSGTDVRLVLDAPAPARSQSVSPFYGSINPFYGSINPFYGSINPFYGDISPFWGDITPFYGDINPFYGSIDPFYGDIDPFWGDITPFFGNNKMWPTVMPFWRDAGPQWGDINTSWTQLQSTDATNYSGLQSQLKTFLNQNAAFWGAAVQKYTHKNFYDGFANAMLAQYGINPNDPSSLANVSVETRSAFFLNWYDGLMSFTGADHVDWWMPAVNWTPELTQTQGAAGRSVIGVLDSTFKGTDTDVDNLTFVGGFKAYVNDHGGAVASLIAAQHDGQGVMGIAPNSDILLYNPFDQTGTAGWSDVAQGISTLYAGGAHVVNASLGVPGWTLSKEWSDILTGPALSNRQNDLIIVKAAGNEGVRQTANVPWSAPQAPDNLLIVGSVGPTGQISSFSNTPGEACITIQGYCAEQNKLKYRYLVAPGELILVSDGNGGVTRMSGTSFAAPLVTGAVALLQDRWPWLQSHAAETVQIILRSAKDLGAPGVDPVYGWGELDVEASQSPLDFNNLVVYQPFNYSARQQPATGLFGTGIMSNSPLFANWSPRQLKQSVLNPGQLNLWQKQSAYIVAFENIGSTYRDFTIPLSSMLVGKSQKTGDGTNPFQSYLYHRLIDWAHGNTLDFNAQSVPMSEGTWNLSMVATESTDDETRSGAGPFHSELVASNRDAGLTVRLGEGNGAHSLMDDSGFAFRSDFDPSTGGVNPVLGFASGGAYAQGDIAIGARVRLSVGITQKSDGHSYVDPTFGKLQVLPLDASRASASVMGLEYTVAKGITLTTSYTSLDEDNGLLGAQGSGLFAIDGARTAATTVGAKFALGGGLELSGSATTAHTSSVGFDSPALALSKGGLDSTAYELVATKTGVVGDGDQLRISLAQPLHVESGALEYSSLQVVDRTTGAVGPLTQSWSISGAREYRAEMLYQTAILDGRAEIAGFGVLDVNPPQIDSAPLAVTVGGQFKIDL
ncbi:MAG: S8 family peptidase [Rhizomicrobium sp.]